MRRVLDEKSIHIPSRRPAPPRPFPRRHLLSTVHCMWLLFVRLQIVGNYWGKEKRFEKVKGKEIDWPGPVPPKDIPPCGFDGSKCKDGTVPTVTHYFVINYHVFYCTVLYFCVCNVLQTSEHSARTVHVHVQCTLYTQY